MSEHLDITFGFFGKFYFVLPNALDVLKLLDEVRQKLLDEEV